MLEDTTPEAVEAAEEQAPISNEAQAAGLGVMDLRVLKEVIDVASARGAFRADEFSAIGGTYGRLNNFLQTIDAAAAEANAPAEGEESATDEAPETPESDTNDLTEE